MATRGRSLPSSVSTLSDLQRNILGIMEEARIKGAIDGVSVKYIAARLKLLPGDAELGLELFDLYKKGLVETNRSIPNIMLLTDGGC